MLSIISFISSLEYVSRAKKLSDLAIDKICEMVMVWKGDPAGEEAQFKELEKYFQCIPGHVCDEILDTMTTFYSEDFNGYIVPTLAVHVALFVRDNISILNGVFGGGELLFQNLLNICGPKFKNLKQLGLPDNCHVDIVTSRKICEFMPDLQIFDLEFTTFDEGAMQFIANLPLVKFNPGRSISELGIATLCGPNSKAKKTLRVLDIGDYKLPIKCYHKVLYSMEKIEDFGGEHSKWLNSLPSELQKREFNLKKLNFDSSIDLIEKEMEVAVMTCPKMREIEIRSNAFTPRIICNLTKFKELVNLNTQVESNLNPNIEDDSQLWERTCLDNAMFPSLTKLILLDSKGFWISIGYFFRILEMCPHLDTLVLTRSDGFSNKIAAQLTSLMLNRNLKRLFIEIGGTLGAIGVCELLRIPTLKELKLRIIPADTVFERSDFQCISHAAEKYNVHVELDWYPDIDMDDI